MHIPRYMICKYSQSQYDKNDNKENNSGKNNKIRNSNGNRYNHDNLIVIIVITITKEARVEEKKC